jgi:hypothetical protein
VETAGLTRVDRRRVDRVSIEQPSRTAERQGLKHRRRGLAGCIDLSKSGLRLFCILSTNKGHDFFQAVWLTRTPMNDCMTIRTDRAKVLDWIDLVFRANLRQLLQVMHMNQPFTCRAVP